MRKYMKRGFTIIIIKGHCLIYKGDEFLESCDPEELNATLDEIESEG